MQHKVLPLTQENSFQDHKKVVLQVIALKNILNSDIEEKVQLFSTHMKDVPQPQRHPVPGQQTDQG